MSFDQQVSPLLSMPEANRKAKFCGTSRRCAGGCSRKSPARGSPKVKTAAESNVEKMKQDLEALKVRLRRCGCNVRPGFAMPGNPRHLLAGCAAVAELGRVERADLPGLG